MTSLVATMRSRAWRCWPSLQRSRFCLQGLVCAVRRDLPGGRARRAPEDKVARRQRQQSADDSPLVPAKIVKCTNHIRTRAAFYPSANDGRKRVRIPLSVRRGTGRRTPPPPACPRAAAEIGKSARLRLRQLRRARPNSESEKRSKLAQTQQRRADWDGGSRDRRVCGPRASFKILRPSGSMSLRLLGDRGTAREKSISCRGQSHHQLTIFQK